MLYVWLSPIIVFLTFSATRFVPALAAALLALMLSAVVVIGARPVAVTPLASIEIFIAGAWIAAASIMTGSLLTVLSPVRFAIGQAISGASDRDAARIF